MYCTVSHHTDLGLQDEAGNERRMNVVVSASRACALRRYSGCRAVDRHAGIGRIDRDAVGMAGMCARCDRALSRDASAAG